MPTVYDWIGAGQTSPNAVLVTITEGPHGPQAEVTWPANADTPGGDYLYPTPVPLALTRAMDVRDHYDFDRIVIRLDDTSLWDPKWGELKRESPDIKGDRS